MPTETPDPHPTPQRQASSRRKRLTSYISLGVAVALILLALLFAARWQREKQAADELEERVKRQLHEKGKIVSFYDTLPGLLSLDLGGGVKLDLALIRTGEFSMGDAAIADAKPVHQVDVPRPFYLGQYAVTQAQYEKVLKRNPRKFKGADLPVEQVTYDDAQAFCGALGNTLAQPPNSDAMCKIGTTSTCWNVLLPTEAEWEYACRAGTTTPYYSGATEQDLAKVAWYWANADGRTHPVGQKAPTPGDCTTCTATCGSGALITTTRNTIAFHPLTTRRFRIGQRRRRARAARRLVVSHPRRLPFRIPPQERPEPALRKHRVPRRAALELDAELSGNRARDEVAFLC